MTPEEKIIEKAKQNFDVTGATILPGGNTLLILGLESTPEVNLDEFGRKGGKFIMYGFRRHAAPRLESIINYIHKKGFSAETFGIYGYPREEDINLKNEVIKAGLGFRGKNTVVLHPEFGPRLRFMAIKTSARLVKENKNPFYYEVENPKCRNCSICIDVCPVRVLQPYRLASPSSCLSNIVPQTKDGRSILCDKCITKCPA